MQAPAMRALLGFIAAAISVLTFHQGMWAALHLLALPGLGMPPPYPMGPVPPWGVPQILNLCFWGGLYGAVLGLLLPRLSTPPWVHGLILGIVAVLVGFFIVGVIKGRPISNAAVPMNWVRPLLINGFWGIGVGVILSFLVPRRRV